MNPELESAYDYKVFTSKQIREHMNDCILKVHSIIQIPVSVIKILLNQYKWNMDRLCEKYYEDGLDKVFNVTFTLPSTVEKDTDKVSRGPETCEICFDELESSMLDGMACGHRFCVECWREYLTTKIMKEGIAEEIHCPAHKCGIFIDEETILRLVIDSNTRSKYHYLVSKTFVEGNHLMKWCPRPNCNNVIEVQYVDSQSVRCSCGYAFCFSCGESWHYAFNCSLLKKWQKICVDDIMSSNWISVNAKNCPKCSIAIEKNGGCNHMRCRTCSTEFCWVCLKPWGPHVPCNVYIEGQNAAIAQQASRIILEKYTFFSDRYKNHKQSLMLEYNLYSAMKEKMKQLQEQHDVLEAEVKFLKIAVDVLGKCRQILMSTYIFAYFIKKNNQLEIFVENQRDLENATELLSECLEKEVTNENALDMKQKVLDRYEYCKTRCKVLLEHISEGHKKRWWKYTE